MIKKAEILVIYTGGTIGMVEDPETGTLNPFNFHHLTLQIPELKQFGFRIESISFEPVIDSSNMQPQVWVRLAHIIEENYESYDGFVVLHGSDTMAYTASALSFMLENLSKPVILTGSQLPIGKIRTDGKENFITSLEIAAAQKDGKALVPEVCIYFEFQLYRGNRTHKYNADHFQAFRSVNYPVLAKAGVEINYNQGSISQPVNHEFRIFTKLDTSVAILTLFPGISPEIVAAILNIPGLKAIVLETYGSGNAPNYPWFLDELKGAINSGLIVYNVSQCRGGGVKMGMYETSIELQKMGVVSGHDITREAAIAKLMYLLGHNYPPHLIRKYLEIPLRGEMTVQ